MITGLPGLLYRFGNRILDPDCPGPHFFRARLARFRTCFEGGREEKEKGEKERGRKKKRKGKRRIAAKKKSGQQMDPDGRGRLKTDHIEHLDRSRHRHDQIDFGAIGESNEARSIFFHGPRKSRCVDFDTGIYRERNVIFDRI